MQTEGRNCFSKSSAIRSKYNRAQTAGEGGRGGVGEPGVRGGVPADDPANPDLVRTAGRNATNSHQRRYLGPHRAAIQTS